MLPEVEFVVGFPQPAKWLINLWKNIIEDNKDVLEVESNTTLGKTRTIHFYKMDQNKKITNYYKLIYDHSYENMERIYLEENDKVLFDKNVKGYVLIKEEFPIAVKVISDEILKAMDLKK